MALRGRGRQIWIAAAALVLIAAVSLAFVRAGEARRAALLRADPDAIPGDAELAGRALSRGRVVFAQVCASCHGDGGKPDQRFGVPDLTDADHLYGSGGVAEIEQIVLHGIRSRDSRGWNLAVMPAYAHARPSATDPAVKPLSPRDVADLTQFLLSFTGRSADPGAAARGRSLYAGRGGCYDCHGSDAGGDPAIGAPTLSDDVWLYGGSPAAIARTLKDGRQGVSPAFAKRLAPADVRAVAVYTASLEREQHDGR